MVDYVAVLKKTIDNLPKNTPEIRARIYDKARQTVVAKLDLIKPTPSQALRDKQMSALDDAIRTIEAEYGAPPPPPESEPEPDFDTVFDDLPPAPEPPAPPPVHDDFPPAPVQPDAMPVGDYPEPAYAEPEAYPDAPAPEWHSEVTEPPAPAEPRDALADWMDTIDDPAPEPVRPAVRADDPAAPPRAPQDHQDFGFPEDLVAKAAGSAERLDDVVVPPIRTRSSGGKGLVIGGVVGAVLLAGAGYSAVGVAHQVLASSSHPDAKSPFENAQSDREFGARIPRIQMNTPGETVASGRQALDSSPAQNHRIAGCKNEPPRPAAVRRRHIHAQQLVVGSTVARRPFPSTRVLWG